MKTKRNLLAAVLVGALAAPAFAQTPAPITTPDKLQTRLGTLEFKDGAPSKETVEKVYANLDFMHATEAFVNAFQGASTSALWCDETTPIRTGGRQNPRDKTGDTGQP